MPRANDRSSLSIALLGLSASLMMAACGGGGDEPASVAAPTEIEGMLRPVRSATELEYSLKSSLTEVAALGQPRAPVMTTASGDAGFSTTYTAEAGVDEFDYARFDGAYLYVAPTPWSNTQTARSLRILSTDRAGGTARQVSAIPIEGRQQVQGLFVADGRLVMLTSEVNYRPWGEIWIARFLWQPTTLELHVFDINDPVQPVRILHATMDGVFVATRRIGDRVYLVSRHSPPVPTDSSGRSLIASMTLGELLPKVTVAGLPRPLVAPPDCYVTSEANPQRYPVLTTITSFSMQDPAALVSTCYNGEANGIYASPVALYVSQPWTAGTTRTAATRIHKFAFNGAAPAYAGSAEIPGSLWMGDQRDFRMSEHEGMLRVITTEHTADPADSQDHRLFVLRPRAGAAALEVVASLPSAARPEELGKPNEALYGVRFLGDRAYAITFRQSDPLYVLDLANPADPRIAGQLEIPGFSDFLHPVTQDLLLGLGREAGNLKLELFDVSVLERPQSRGRILFEGLTSDSEALSDRHAFTWLQSQAVDRFAIPATVTPLTQPATPVQRQSSLHQFEILGKQSTAGALLRAAGVVTPPTVAAERFAASSRAFIHGDTVYYVRDGKVWSTSWYAPSQVRGPY